MPFGLQSTLRTLNRVTLREVPRSPDGGLIADYEGSIDDPLALAAFFDSTPGVVAHGLFPPSLIYEILVGRDEKVQRLVPPS
jgi:ribose 5-phosphate isomerase A